MKSPLALFLTSCCFLAFASAAGAAAIAVNFSENNGNQNWLSATTPIGPLGTLTGNFNSTNNPNANGPANTHTGNLTAGTIGAMVDSNGAPVSTTVTFSSANPYYNSSGTATDEARLAVGYLDDGGAGASISVFDIPYSLYDVYVLLGSDAGNEHTSEIPLVNGVPVLAADFPAFGNLTGSGGGWVEADGTNRGNFVMVRGLTGAGLTIAGQNNTGNRIGISGFLINQVPEPSAAIYGLLGATLVAVRRRR